MLRKVLIFAAVFTAVVTLTIVATTSLYKDNRSLFDQFRSFSVTIDNRSDFELSVFEVGTYKSAESEGNVAAGESKAAVDKTIRSGDRLTVKPKLSIVGEGGIYLKMTDANGDPVTHGVCSYTESLSGKSKVTVTNEGVKIEQNCH